MNQLIGNQQDRPVQQSRRGLDAIFQPRTVAIVGATEAIGSVGRTLASNLLHGSFNGKIFPVNPKRETVLGNKAYPNIAAIPEPLDLVVIATPAATVPDLIRQCVDAGVSAAIIISAGFREVGTAGAELERQVLEQARRGRMRLIGPNCLGVMNPLTGFNATFARGIAKPGNLAFISQSGALLTAILDWSFTEMVGFSAVVSTGSMLDVSWGDLIDYLGDDPHTRSILIYMESIGDARSFLSAAREVALSKPIIVLKAGRTEAAAKAAASHTGALTGADDVLDAAFRRCGVLRVDRIADLFSMADVLAKQPRPRGPRLTVVTNAGGPGVLATDALLATGGELAKLSPELMSSLNEILPPQWSHNNPIDVLGDAPPERFAKALKTAAADANNDGVLVVLTPQDMTDPSQTAEAIKPLARLGDKPLLASWMGAAQVAAGRDILNRAGIPTFEYPDTAARAFTYMWRYTYNLRALYETPAAAGVDFTPDRDSAEKIISQNRQAGQYQLDEEQSKRLLSAYGIPVVMTTVATSAEDAMKAAGAAGFPVVVKLYSKTITHKTDVGGVKLNLATSEQVARAFDEIRESVRKIAGPQHFQGVTVQPMIDTRGAYELIVGSSPDAQFGPVLLFGTGGQLVEVFKDHALALPPLNATLARRMMEQTKIYRALQGVRGRKSVDIDLLCRIMARFSNLIVEQPWIKEIEINPLICSEKQLIAVDARAVLWSDKKSEADLPRPAIRPYPTQYVMPWKLHDGTAITIRPIRPEDEPMLVRFHEGLSDRSVMLRYFHPMKLSARTTHERLIRVCYNDYDRELALVAEGRRENAEKYILGVGRLSKLPKDEEAEYSIIVGDAWQGKGLGTQLLKLLLRVACDEKIQRVTATILPENLEMQKISEALGFKLERSMTDSTVSAVIDPRMCEDSIGK